MKYRIRLENSQMVRTSTLYDAFDVLYYGMWEELRELRARRYDPIEGQKT